MVAPHNDCTDCMHPFAFLAWLSNCPYNARHRVPDKVAVVAVGNIDSLDQTETDLGAADDVAAAAAAPVHIFLEIADSRSHKAAPGA